MYTQVLQYHVVPNQALKAAQLTNGQLLASELQNQPVKVESHGLSAPAAPLPAIAPCTVGSCFASITSCLTPELCVLTPVHGRVLLQHHTNRLNAICAGMQHHLCMQTETCTIRQQPHSWVGLGVLNSLLGRTRPPLFIFKTASLQTEAEGCGSWPSCYEPAGDPDVCIQETRMLSALKGVGRQIPCRISLWGLSS